MVNQGSFHVPHQEDGHYGPKDFFFLLSECYIMSINGSQDSREGERLFNYSLPLPPASQTLRQLDDCDRELISALT